MKNADFCEIPMHLWHFDHMLVARSHHTHTDGRVGNCVGVFLQKQNSKKGQRKLIKLNDVQKLNRSFHKIYGICAWRE